MFGVLKEGKVFGRYWQVKKKYSYYYQINKDLLIESSLKTH